MKLYLKMERFIKVNGSVIKSRALEFKYGQTELDTRVIGSIIKHKERVNFGM